MYYTIKRALALKDSLVMFSNSEWAHNGKSTTPPPPPQAPSHPKGKCCFGVTLLPGPLPILLMLGSCVPAAAPQIPKINLEYWRSYEDLEEMHGAHEAAELIVGILHRAHNTQYVGLFLKTSIWKLETSPKRHIVACGVFNTFVDTFRKKLLMLLDDVEQFFLWVVAAMLDGRRIGFD